MAEAADRLAIRRAGVVAAAVFVGYVALYLANSGRTGGPAEAVLTGFRPATGFVAVLLGLRAARSACGRQRAAWAVITASIASWSLGELIWALESHRSDRVPFPSWADFFYLAYIPLMATGLLLLPSAGSWRIQSRAVLDSLIVTGSLFLISWITSARDMWQSDAAGGELAVSMTYPVGDVMILALALLALTRVRAGLRTPAAILFAALVCSAVGTGVWTYVSGSPRQDGLGPEDVFYVAQSVLFVVAMVAAVHVRPGTVRPDAQAGWHTVWLPLVPIVVAVAFCARRPADVVRDPLLLILVVFLVLATLVRQLLQSADLFQRERQVRLLADRLSEDLDSAARYVASILPGEMTGPVTVSSRYVPSRAVGGDSFDYTWIDEDHLIVYLLDVSGHGVRPALLSVSVHNLLRSGGLPKEILLQPDCVLAELNQRFTMDSQDDHYFTMWYGVFRLTTSVLRYSSAGHPPPLVTTADSGFSAGTLEGRAAMPVGMFADTEFGVAHLAVAPGTSVLLYSDGVLGDPPDLAGFARAYSEAAADPEFTLDRLIEPVPDAIAAPDVDDRSLVRMTFPGYAGRRRDPRAPRRQQRPGGCSQDVGDPVLYVGAATARGECLKRLVQDAEGPDESHRQDHRADDPGLRTGSPKRPPGKPTAERIEQEMAELVPDE